MRKNGFAGLIMMIVALLILSGCRYRLLTDQNPPAEYEQEDYDMSEMPIIPENQHESPNEELAEELTETAYTEAQMDNFSPLTLELAAEDAHRYSTTGDEGDNAHAQANAHETAGNTISLEQVSDFAGDAVFGADGGVVGLISTYTNILRQGVNTIFPCQLLYVYIETTAELVTVVRNSDLYRLIESSGGQNISTRLPADMLNVTADWVVRRNPDVIVKIVDSTILGNGITNTQAATFLMQSIKQRPSWDTIEAIRDNRIILLSEEMLETEAMQLAAQLMIAQVLYPELFEGIDLSSAIAGLLMDADGIYFYQLF